MATGTSSPFYSGRVTAVARWIRTSQPLCSADTTTLEELLCKVSGADPRSGICRDGAARRSGPPSRTSGSRWRTSSSKAIWSRSSRRCAASTRRLPRCGAAGMQVTVTLVDVCRVVDGRVIEQWGGPDTCTRWASSTTRGRRDRSVPAAGRGGSASRWPSRSVTLDGPGGTCHGDLDGEARSAHEVRAGHGVTQAVLGCAAWAADPGGPLVCRSPILPRKGKPWWSSTR